METKDRFDLTDSLLNKYKGRPKTIGRYAVSDVWAIEKGYLTLRKFLEGQTNDFESCFRMWEGRRKHEQCQELLEGYEIEKKVEYKHNDWLLVGKADAINSLTNEGLEIKTSDKLLDKAKSWHEYQAKIYCSMFQVPIFYIVQPRIKENRIILKVLAEIERDDKWFEKKLKVIDKFHQELYGYTEIFGTN